ncbi:Deoxycytidine monophosphate (dCMP) deaminase [Binucleata daphniae]
MLILLYGPQKSGKKTVKEYLVKHKNFEEIKYTNDIYQNLVKNEKWCKDYVTLLPNIDDYMIYKKRPCARLILLLAPTSTDWRNENDDQFNKILIDYRDCYWINNYSTVKDLQYNIDKCLENVRPSWDIYFIKIAMLVSKRSNCMKGRVGCVLVKDKRIISTGYNGTPFKAVNCYENGCKRCNEGARNNEKLEYCLCIHAEENALLFAGFVSTAGTTLYVTTFPCQLCCRKIVQMEIKRIVYSVDYGVADSIVNEILSKAGIEICKVTV